MIDTEVLLLSSDTFTITNTDTFVPSSVAAYCAEASKAIKTIFSTRSWQRIITETQVVEILEIESALSKIRY